MHRICPQCQGTFASQFLCPNCGIQLLDMPDRSAANHGVAGDPGLHMRNVGRQLLAGLLLSQALYYALRQTATGLTLLHISAEPNNLLVLAGLEVVGTLAGGLVAGAGNPRGLAAGAAVGVLNAIILVGTQFALGGRPTDGFLFGGWIPNAALGVIGGFLGRRMWPSVHDLPRSPGAAKEKKPNTVREATPSAPIAWFRVLGGAALAVGCAVWAGRIRDGMIGLGEGAFVLDSHIQSQFIAWVITTLAIMLGGAFAGAGSRGGLKNGFLVGLLACVCIFIIHREVVKEALPAVEFFTSVLSLPETQEASWRQTVLFLITNTLLVGVVSGWFGSLLLPKLGERRTEPLDHAAI